MKTNKNDLFIIFLVILLITAISCSKQINPVGTYVTEGAITSDTLKIESNGQFCFIASDWDNGCYGGQGSRANGKWRQYENNLHFIIDSKLKPKVSIVPNDKETLIIKFFDIEGNRITSRTTIGVNMNNTQVNNFYPRKDRYNDVETKEYNEIHKVMMYMIGSQSYLYIPVFGKASTIEVSNIIPNVYFEIEDSNFEVRRKKLKSRYCQEYANHDKRRINVISKKYKRIKDYL